MDYPSERIPPRGTAISDERAIPLTVDWNCHIHELGYPPGINQYREEYGPVLWWVFPINEPPYVGTPNDSEWPGYHTHWTPIWIPPDPTEAEAAAKDRLRFVAKYNLNPPTPKRRKELRDAGRLQRYSRVQFRSAAEYKALLAEPDRHLRLDHLVDAVLSCGQIFSWWDDMTSAEIALIDDWAIRSYLYANGNDVEIPPMPARLAKAAGWKVTK